MRLLHPWHGDERHRPGEREAKSKRTRHPRIGSRAISAAARAITTSSRPIQAGAQRHGGRQVMTVQGIGAAVRRKEDFRFLTGTRHLHRRHQPPRPAPCLIPALAACACANIIGIDTAEAKQAPGRRCDLHRRRHGRRQSRQSPVWLADQQQGRLAHGRAAASAACGRSRAPCRRPGRCGHRRDTRPGARCRRADRRSTMRS